MIQFAPVTLCHCQKYWCCSDRVFLSNPTTAPPPPPRHTDAITKPVSPWELQRASLKLQLHCFYAPMPKVSWHKSVFFWSTSLGSGDSLFGVSNNRDSLRSTWTTRSCLIKQGYKPCEYRCFNYLRKSLSLVCSVGELGILQVTSLTLQGAGFCLA